MIDEIKTKIETNEGFVYDHEPTKRELIAKINELIKEVNRLKDNDEN